MVLYIQNDGNFKIVYFMENLEIKNTALYQTIQSTIKEMLKQNIDDVLDSVMPIFEPFIRERLNQYEEYRKLQVTATAPITVVHNEALDKFKTLQIITFDRNTSLYILIKTV